MSPTPAAERRAQTPRHVALLLTICALTFFLNLGGTRLWDRDEPRNAGCTREMLQRGDWVTPMFNGELRTHKPVLLYWLMMTSYAVFGQNEWGARFWSAALAAGSVLMTYAIGRRLFNASAALWGGVVLASNLQFAMIGRAATPEMLFSFCLTAVLFVYVFGAFRRKDVLAETIEPTVPLDADAKRPFFPSWPVAFLMYAVVGLAVLAKGPAGLVLPVAALGMFLLVVRMPEPSVVEDVAHLPRSRRWLRAAWRVFHPVHFMRTAWSMRPITALVAAGIVALPWYVMVWHATTPKGAWVKGFLFEHNIGRAARAMEGHGGGALLYPLTVLFYYPLATLVGLMPWSILAVPVIMDAWKRVRRRDPWSPGYVLLACWVGVIMAAFAVARTKLPSYMTPIYPALALGVGCFIHHWVRGRAAVPNKSLTDALLVLAGIGVGLWTGLPIGAWLYMRGELWLGFVALIPIAGALLALRLLKQGDRFAAARVFSLMAVAIVTAVFAVVMVRVDKYQHSHGVMRAIHARSDHPQIASFNRLEPSWVFYSGQTVEDYKSSADAARFLASSPDAFIITSEEKLPQLKPALPDGVGVVAKVPYFGRKGQLLVIGRENGNGAVAGTGGKDHTEAQVKGS